MIVPAWGLLPACKTIAPEITTPASKNAFFIGAPQSVIWLRDFVLSSQCKAIASRDGDRGVNRNDKKWAHPTAAKDAHATLCSHPRICSALSSGGSPGLPVYPEPRRVRGSGAFRPEEHEVTHKGL